MSTIRSLTLLVRPLVLFFLALCLALQLAFRYSLGLALLEHTSKLNILEVCVLLRLGFLDLCPQT